MPRKSEILKYRALRALYYPKNLPVHVAWKQVPLLRVVFFLIAGILSRHYGFELPYVLVAIVVSVWLYFLFAYDVLVKVHRWGFVVFSMLLWFLVGNFLYNSQERVIKREKIAVLSEGNKWAKILEIKPGERWTRLKSKIYSAVTNDYLGDAIVYHENNEQTDALQVNDFVLVHSAFDTIAKPVYPYNFDAELYWQVKGVSAQSFQRSDESLVVIKGKTNHLIQIREHFLDIIDRAQLSEDNQALAKALLLGDKSELRYEQRELYARSGIAHVLAVSGLHVGIIASFFLFPVGFILKKRKYLIATLHLTAVLVLWLYAAICAFSPSVTRSVIMFSILILAHYKKGLRFPVNFLAGAAFVLIILNPMIVFDLGFQMSFAAVSGILLLFKPLKNHFWISNRILRYILWGILMSISAQLFVLPIQLYHFHKFPLLFAFNSVIAISIMYLVMVSGLVLLLVGSILSILIPWMGYALNWSLDLMSFIPLMQSNWSWAVIDHIYLSTISVLVVVSVIVSISIAIIFKRNDFKYYSLALVGILLLFESWDTFKNRNDFQVYLYRDGYNAAFHVIGHDQSYVIGDSIPESVFSYEHLNRSSGIDSTIFIQTPESILLNESIAIIDNNLYIENRSFSLTMLDHTGYINESKKLK